MRFWQKIFLSSMILFTITFDLGAFILINNSFDESLEREANNSVREEAVIASSLQSSIANVEKFLDGSKIEDSVLYTFIQPLADYYNGQLVTLELVSSDKLVYSNLPKDIGEIALGKQLVESRIVGDKRYMLVVAKLSGYNNLILVYARDISNVDVSRKETVKVFVLVSIGGVLAFGGIIFLLLRRFTSPIDELVATTTKIAAGEYQERVVIHKEDEFGEMGFAFNLMADAVEDKIEELTKQAESKQIFIDDLAHEMKTPMTSIIGYSSLLMQANLSEEQRDNASNYINSSAKRLSGLSEKLLELANLSEDQLDMEELQTEKLLEDLMEHMEYSLKKREITLATSHTIDYIKGDKILLLSLMGNLVENAARASTPGKKITVRIYQDICPVIEVEDEGCGMPAAEVDKVMQPFYKVDKARSRENGGVGLGLSIVQKIAQVHHATVRITSELNVGTTVKVFFTS